MNLINKLLLKETAIIILFFSHLAYGDVYADLNKTEEIDISNTQLSKYSFKIP